MNLLALLAATWIAFNVGWVTEDGRRTRVDGEDQGTIFGQRRDAVDWRHALTKSDLSRKLICNGTELVEIGHVSVPKPAYGSRPASAYDSVLVETRDECAFWEKIGGLDLPFVTPKRFRFMAVRWHLDAMAAERDSCAKAAADRYERARVGQLRKAPPHVRSAAAAEANGPRKTARKKP
jgi:hypothetical protein